MEERHSGPLSLPRQGVTMLNLTERTRLDAKAKIKREPRISIALGQDSPNRLRGLSMAARAAEVTDLAEIDHLNELMQERYPGQTRFSPREVSTAILRATPEIISVIDLPKGPGEPDLVAISSETSVDSMPNAAAFG